MKSTKHFKKTIALITSLINLQRQVQIGRPTSDVELQEVLSELKNILVKLITYQIISLTLLLALIAICINV